MTDKEGLELFFIPRFTDLQKPCIPASIGGISQKCCTSGRPDRQEGIFLGKNHNSFLTANICLLKSTEFPWSFEV